MYSSTQYTDIIMLNSFQLKWVKFTKNEQNKKPLQAHNYEAILLYMYSNCWNSK